MNFGYFCNTTNWDKKPYTQILDEAREITEYCDQNNWNSIWYTEHHFNHEGMESCANPLMMCADAAARTKNIRLGQACNVITFHNPIRLAEDIATLDQMSKGRVEVGIGRGVYGREAINMNKEADLKDQAKNFRLFSETLEIMKKAWSEEFFSHQGEFYTYPSPNFIWQHDMSPPKENVVDLKTNELKQISVLPKPYQKPFPPISQVVDGERSIQWAAENGLNTIMWIPTVKALKKRFEIFKKAKSKAENRDVPLGEGINLVRDMFVAETMDEAKKMAGEHIVNYMRWVCHWRGLGNHMDPGEELPETKNKLDLLNYDFLHKRNLLFGTPEFVIKKINELQQELNLQNLQVWSNFPGVKHEDCMKSIKLFTEEVIPNIKPINTKIQRAS